MHKANPYYFNRPMNCLHNMCNICKMYSCPYCINTPMYNSDSSRHITNYANNEASKISDLIATLNKRGFIVQEGKLSYIDILKLCSEGKVDSCLGNNVGAPYACCFLPPAPNQNPSQGQEPPIGYNPNNPNNNPANIDYIAPGFTYKLRPDEAIVLIGMTPPPALYYCFRSYCIFRKHPDTYSSNIRTVFR